MTNKKKTMENIERKKIYKFLKIFLSYNFIFHTLKPK